MRIRTAVTAVALMIAAAAATVGTASADDFDHHTDQSSTGASKCDSNSWVSYNVMRHECN
ncbi:hypothetical protein GCM10010145_60670 [Streptomyces ruber]|uniref:Uncharacterized protein n=2 Tax=Streptomyces TaxID=1883 RepID=A0A918EXN9_9ACTN|nr:hypothetical protein [Streptomyces ruber]GGQ82908.1 hypothetical protein GCM10010145_60670 [Streptomyces ruber]